MTERDKVILELMQSHDQGWTFVRRHDHTVEIYHGEMQHDDSTSIEWCVGAEDSDGHLAAWLMSHMDNPPSHISKIKHKPGR